MVVKTDIEIAQACEKKKITEIAKTAGIPEAYLEQYGNYKAKVDYKLLKDWADRPDGKLILVTAITSLATVMSKPSSRGTPWALPPRPSTIWRSCRSFISTARFQVICLTSIPRVLPC